MSQTIVKKYKGMYCGADKSLARPWKETSYSNQDLWHTNNISLGIVL